MPADGKSKEGRHSTAYLSFKKIFYFSIFVLLALLFLTSRNIFCQETGFKYIKNYTPKDYNKSPQNWSIIQDKRGVIYIGNRGGLLEFDGDSWRSIAIHNSPARSLAIDKNGIIYIGGFNEIGFLTTDLKGALLYESLRGQLDNNLRNFSMVWQTHSTEEGIYGWD